MSSGSSLPTSLLQQPGQCCMDNLAVFGDVLPWTSCGVVPWLAGHTATTQQFLLFHAEEPFSGKGGKGSRGSKGKMGAKGGVQKGGRIGGPGGKPKGGDKGRSAPAKGGRKAAPKSGPRKGSKGKR